MTCAVACEKSDLQACVWMAQRHGGMSYAARACALDDKHCDLLARQVLAAHPTPEDTDEAVACIAPACAKGDVDACSAILDASTPLRGSVRPALLPHAKSAAQTFCARKEPAPCDRQEHYCRDGWQSVLLTCEGAAETLKMPALSNGALTRARDACKKTPDVCSDVLHAMISRADGAQSIAEKQARNKELVDVAERVIDECKKPGDRACEVLAFAGRFEESPTLARKIAQKQCAVEGGPACSEQARRECNGGKGPLAKCIDALLAGSSRYDDDVEAVEKKVTEACIKDDKRACFAVGVTTAGMSRYLLRGALVDADEAFARGCKLGDAPSCRASKRPAAIAKPSAPPKDALRPSETEAVLVRAKGDGAPLARRILVEEWSWSSDSDAEARSDRGVFDLQEIVALGGLREGADVVVWDERRKRIQRFVAVVNVAH